MGKTEVKSGSGQGGVGSKEQTATISEAVQGLATLHQLLGLPTVKLLAEVQTGPDKQAYDTYSETSSMFNKLH